LIPPTVVSSIDKRHSYETALAYQEAGALLRFVTGVYLSERTAGFVRRLPRVGSRLSKRADSRMETDRVVSMPLLELLGSAAARMLGPTRGHDVLLKRAAMFDRRASGHLADAGLVHGFEFTCARTFAAAKKLGLRTILDAPFVHPLAWRRILEEEILPLATPEERRLQMKDRLDTLRLMEREIDLADAIFSPSEWAASTYRSRVSASERVTIVPYGTRVRDGEPTRPSGRTRFLCLASGLGFRKGTHLLLAAFAPLHEEAELWLAGPVLPELAPWLVAHGQSVRLFGSIGPTQAQELFDQCHAFVSPSLCEGSSLAILEAMGQGLPVIVTERCGAPLENMVQGLVVPANQEAPLTEALVRLRDPDLRLALGTRAKELARQRSWAAYRQAIRQAADLPMAASMSPRSAGAT
jgi:glycosyltransferase involved in cell wall biosynthesis